jgi:YihY family inner membrane protein
MSSEGRPDGAAGTRRAAGVRRMAASGGARLRDRAHALRDAADRTQRSHAWLAVPIAVLRKFGDDQGGNLAALIAYYGFLSVVPLLLALTGILGFVLGGHPSWQAQVLDTVERDFPEVASYLSGTIRGSQVALGVGLAGTLWAGLGVTLAMERAMNAVWDIPFSDRPNAWWSRIRGLSMLGVLGLTFLISTALASLQGIGGAFAIPAAVLGVAGSLGLNTALYLVAFQVLTNHHLAWRALLPGALVGAVGWTALQSFGVLYVGHELAHESTLYGTLAWVIGLVAWLYLGARLTVYAAEVNSVLTHRLWPRSLAGGVRTDGDRRALIRRAEVDRRTKDEVIEVSFAASPASSGAVPPAPAPRPPAGPGGDRGGGPTARPSPLDERATSPAGSHPAEHVVDVADADAVGHQALQAQPPATHVVDEQGEVPGDVAGTVVATGEDARRVEDLQRVQLDRVLPGTGPDDGGPASPARQ